MLSINEFALPKSRDLSGNALQGSLRSQGLGQNFSPVDVGLNKKLSQKVTSQISWPEKENKLKKQLPSLLFPLSVVGDTF